MQSWIEPKAFWLVFCIIGFVQVSKLVGNDYNSIDIATAIFASVIGGVFWGTIGTLIYRRFNKK